MNEIFIQIVDNYDELEKIIINFDEVFIPSLKSRLLDLKQYSKKLYDNAVTIKAVFDNQTVGFASFYCNDNINNIAYLTQIAVLKDARSKGVGSLLLDEVIKICLLKGMNVLKLEVYCNNFSAMNFYEKYGFVDSGFATDESKYMKKVIRKVM